MATPTDEVFPVLFHRQALQHVHAYMTDREAWVVQNVMGDIDPDDREAAATKLAWLLGTHLALLNQHVESMELIWGSDAAGFVGLLVEHAERAAS